MDLNGRPYRKPEYKAELMENEVLIYHPEQDAILHFNTTASLIWQLCDGTRTAMELINLLQEAYPDSADDIAADVPDMLDQFILTGCIEVKLAGREIRVG